MKTENLITVIGVLFVASIGVFGLSIAGYAHPPPQLYPVIGTLTVPLQKVTISGKGGGLRYQLAMSALSGEHTAIIRDFESHKPSTQAAVQHLTVGSTVMMSFITRDFFTSPCDVWAIETSQREVLSFNEPINVKRTKEFRAALASGVLSVAFALWGALTIFGRRQSK